MEQSVLQKNFRGDEKKEVFIENHYSFLILMGGYYGGI
jgi:hypothetical protein